MILCCRLWGAPCFRDPRFRGSPGLRCRRISRRARFDLITDLTGRQDPGACRLGLVADFFCRLTHDPSPCFALSQVSPPPRLYPSPHSSPSQVPHCPRLYPRSGCLSPQTRSPPRVPQRPGFRSPRGERPQTRVFPNAAARPDSPTPQETPHPRKLAPILF